jgi:hypothetical protein
MSSRSSRIFKRKSRKVDILQPTSINNNMERLLMETAPRSMKQGSGWVGVIRRNQNTATHEAQANMASMHRVHAATTAGKNKVRQDMGIALRDMLIQDTILGSSHHPGPKLPRRKHMPAKTGETEPREFYVTLNNMPVTPTKTPTKTPAKSKSKSRRTPGTPYERMDNTPSPAKSPRSKKLITPPRFNNLVN